jgi:hypothetical protein
VRLTVLPSAYNAQISMNALALRSAKIVHFFTRDLESSLETIAHTAAKRLKREGILDTSAIRSAVESANPWTRIDSYRKAIAAKSYSYVGRLAFDRLTKRLGI